MNNPAVSFAALGLYAQLSASRMGMELQVANSVQQIGATATRCARALLVADRGLLMVLPLHQPALTAWAAVSSLSDDFKVFPLHARRWTWSTVLEVQVDQLLVQLDELVAQARSQLGCSVAFVYLNGGFRRKYYPCDASSETEPICAPRIGAEGRWQHHNLHGVLQAFGPQSLLNTQADDCPDQTSRYQHSPHFGVVGIGRGNTDRKMSLGASFEFIERWVALQRPEGVLHAPYVELKGLALQPHEVWGLTDDDAARVFPGYSPTLPIDWAPASREISGRPTHVPLDLVSYLRPTSTSLTPQRNSNGCALGNSPAEAALFAALEVIERDALLLAWYGQRSPPRLRTEGIDCDTSRELLQLLASRGYALTLCDVTTEFQIPAVVAVLKAKEEHGLGAFVTANAHPDPRHALRSALAEAWSLLATAERNIGQRAGHGAAAGTPMTHLSHARLYGQAAGPARFDILCHGPDHQTCDEFFAAHPYTPMTPETAYRRLCERIDALALELVLCDTTPSLLRPMRLYSARAYIPGTLYLTFGEPEPRMPADRFKRAANLVPWARGMRTPHHFPLHPLG